jgi:hypothetical protein
MFKILIRQELQTMDNLLEALDGRDLLITFVIATVAGFAFSYADQMLLAHVETAAGIPATDWPGKSPVRSETTGKTSAPGASSKSPLQIADASIARPLHKLRRSG